MESVLQGVDLLCAANSTADHLCCSAENSIGCLLNDQVENLYLPKQQHCFCEGITGKCQSSLPKFGKYLAT